MNAIPFDTLKLARRLRESAGFTPEHAEAAAEAFAEAMSSSDVATKADLKELATKADVADIRLELSETKAELKADAAANKADLLKVIIGTTIAALAVNSAVVLGAMYGLAKLPGH